MLAKLASSVIIPRQSTKSILTPKFGGSATRGFSQATFLRGKIMKLTGITIPARHFAGKPAKQEDGHEHVTAHDSHHHQHSVPRPTHDQWGIPIRYDESGDVITGGHPMWNRPLLQPGEKRPMEDWEPVTYLCIFLFLLLLGYNLMYNKRQTTQEWAREQIEYRRAQRALNERDEKNFLIIPRSIPAILHQPINPIKAASPSYRQKKRKFVFRCRPVQPTTDVEMCKWAWDKHTEKAPFDCFPMANKSPNKKEDEEYDYVLEKPLFPPLRTGISFLRSQVQSLWRGVKGIGVAIDEQYKPLEQQLHLEIVRDTFEDVERRCNERPGYVPITALGLFAFLSFRKSRPFLIAPLFAGLGTAAGAYYMIYPEEASALARRSIQRSAEHFGPEGVMVQVVDRIKRGPKENKPTPVDTETRLPKSPSSS